MKRFTKGLLAALLVITVVVSACAFTGVFSSAQALNEGVTIAFNGADNDWVTLSGTTIQDKALQAVVYNYSEDDIILTKIESNGTNIVYSGWTSNRPLTSGSPYPIGISGTTTNNAVLTVTVTYYIKGNPTATAETCTAYIYCSSSQTYSSVSNEGIIDSGFGVYGLDTQTKISPMTAGTTTMSEDSRQSGVFKGKCHEPTTTCNIYVDGSKYKNWDEINLQFAFYNGDKRDHAYFDRLEMSQTSNSGSLMLVGFGTDAENKSITSEFDKDAQTGFFIQTGEKTWIENGFTGTIPTEATSSYTIKMRQYGQTGGIFGLASFRTAPLYFTWNFTVYNNNKSALRERLIELSNEGLNKASYKSGWDAYETAMKNAYKVLGTLNATSTQISNAISEVNNARNALVRYAVIITNHYYYTDDAGEQTVLLKKEYKMNANNNAVFAPSVLTNGQYLDYPFNRTNAVRSLTVSVGESTNYTKEINQYYWYVDTAALEAAIAEQANRKHLDEEGNNLFTDDSWQAYVDAAAQAQRVLGDQTLFQNSMDAEVKNLNAAKAALKRLDIDTEWLAEGIQWAGNIIDNYYEDDQGLGWDTDALFASTYSQRLYAKLVAAYNEAVEVTNDPDFTKSQADRVCALLWEAIDGLRVKDETTKGLLINDKVRHADIEKYGYFKGLQNQLKEDNGLLPVYEDILDNTKGSYMLNEADFTADSWYMLQDALYGDFAQGSFALAMTEEPYEADNANGELSVPAYSMIHNIWFLASQADYNACRDNLLNRVYNLEWDVDASALLEKYDEVYDTDFSLYTPASSERLIEDIDAVAEVLQRLEEPQLYGDPNAITNDTIADLVYELNEAKNELRLMPALQIPEEGVIAPIGDMDDFLAVDGQGTTAGEVLASVSVLYNEEEAIVKLYNDKGRELALNNKVGTGTTLVLSLDDGTIIESHEFVVKGDVTGNAQTGVDDLNTVLNFAFTENGLLEDSVYYLAGDLNGDGVVDLSDAIMMEEMIG